MKGEESEIEIDIKNWILYYFVDGTTRISIERNSETLNELDYLWKQVNSHTCFILAKLIWYYL